MRHAVLVGAVLALAPPAPAEERTFTNPICAHGADPWVVRYKDAYYYCHSGGGTIRVNKAARLQEIGQSPGAAVWTPPPGTNPASWPNFPGWMAHICGPEASRAQMALGARGSQWTRAATCW